DLQLMTYSEELSHKTEGQIYVVVEALYSMNGDVAPLSEMADMCQKYGAALIIDEAHSHGIYGGNGEGLIVQLGLQDKVFAGIYTFGKAAGLHGAVICGSHILKAYLINFCRTFIYTTAPSPYMRAATQQAYVRLETAKDARLALANIITYFQSRAGLAQTKSSYWLPSSSPIQGLIIPGNARAKSLSTYLQSQGFAIKAILSPTVKSGTERLRISLHSFNTAEQIDDLMQAIDTWFNQFDTEQAA
ncbi:MAG: aminotransferase class I/II-fold pyridoxal phosphate-dependent enzyme, partial [Litorimonas sp.]